METIDLTQAGDDLQALGADETTRELILNNLKLYNNLVLDYTIDGITKNLYLTYQLSVQISKQIGELKRFNKSTPPEGESTLEKLIGSLKDTPKPGKKN
jgi:hypothetical protein